MTDKHSLVGPEVAAEKRAALTVTARPDEVAKLRKQMEIDVALHGRTMAAVRAAFQRTQDDLQQVAA